MTCFGRLLSVLGFLFIFNICLADRVYLIKNQKILMTDTPIHSLSGLEIYAATENDVHIMFNDMSQKKLHLFFKISGIWNQADRAIPWYTQAGLFSDRERPQLYTVEIEPVEKNISRTKVSIYRSLDNKWDLSAADVTLYLDQKEVFSNEEHKEARALFPWPDKPNVYLLLGLCTERKWDPLSMLGNIISGGHGAFSRWPFLAEINNGQVSCYHKWPEKFESNEIMVTPKMFVFKNKCHLVGEKYKEYLPSLQRIEYSDFDMEQKTWSKPVEIYKETSKDSARDATVGCPAVLATGSEVLVTWSLRDDGLLGSGVFVRSKVNEKWSVIEKLSSSGDSPLLVEGQNGEIFIFWREEGKGLFCSSYEYGSWSKPCLAVIDEKIATGNTLWNITSDTNGDFHLVYEQKVSDIDRWHLNIVYVLFEKNSAVGTSAQN
jgi:hypothetical protein